MLNGSHQGQHGLLLRLFYLLGANSAPSCSLPCSPRVTEEGSVPSGAGELSGLLSQPSSPHPSRGSAPSLCPFFHFPRVGCKGSACRRVANTALLQWTKCAPVPGLGFSVAPWSPRAFPEEHRGSRFRRVDTRLPPDNAVVEAGGERELEIPDAAAGEGCEAEVPARKDGAAGKGRPERRDCSGERSPGQTRCSRPGGVKQEPPATILAAAAVAVAYRSCHRGCGMPGKVEAGRGARELRRLLRTQPGRCRPPPRRRRGGLPVPRLPLATRPLPPSLPPPGGAEPRGAEGAAAASCRRPRRGRPERRGAGRGEEGRRGELSPAQRSGASRAEPNFSAGCEREDLNFISDI